MAGERLKGIVGLIEWPYEDAIEDDGGSAAGYGNAWLEDAGGRWEWWAHYYSADPTLVRVATDAEVIDALLARVREDGELYATEAPFMRLGRAVAGVLPEALERLPKEGS